MDFEHMLDQKVSGFKGRGKLMGNLGEFLNYYENYSVIFRWKKFDDED